VSRPAAVPRPESSAGGAGDSSPLPKKGSPPRRGRNFRRRRASFRSGQIPTGSASEPNRGMSGEQVTRWGKYLLKQCDPTHRPHIDRRPLGVDQARPAPGNEEFPGAYQRRSTPPTSSVSATAATTNPKFLRAWKLLGKIFGWASTQTEPLFRPLRRRHFRSERASTTSPPPSSFTQSYRSRSRARR
jgi:hypothetical protein